MENSIKYIFFFVKMKNMKNIQQDSSQTLQLSPYNQYFSELIGLLTETNSTEITIDFLFFFLILLYEARIVLK